MARPLICWLVSTQHRCQASLALLLQQVDALLGVAEPTALHELLEPWLWTWAVNAGARPTRRHGAHLLCRLLRRARTEGARVEVCEALGLAVEEVTGAILCRAPRLRPVCAPRGRPPR